MDNKSYTSLHNHTFFSNTHGIRDAISSPEESLDYALEMGLNGIVFTEHETLSSHMRLMKYYNKNHDKFKDMKLGFGNEIYLVDKDESKKAVDENQSTKFYHFIVIAKNRKGYQFLMEESSKAWGSSFHYRGVMRTPTYYDEFKEMVAPYKGSIIGSTACEGGIIPQLILEYNNNRTKENYDKIIKKLEYFVDVFGKDDFYLELQPGDDEQQLINSYLIKISKAFGIKTIITTDSHYIKKEDQQIHEIYLKAGNSDRDVASFYGYNYIMSAKELSEYFDDATLQESFDNSNKINQEIESYSLGHSAIMPEPHIPDFNNIDLNAFDSSVDWKLYKNIVYFNKSDEISNKYYLKLILDGMTKRKQPVNDKTLGRIDIELGVVKDISDYFKQPLSKYFLADKEFVDIIWNNSLLGIARGSAACFYTNYLLDIVQINALDENYNLPYFRFANSARVDSMFDIDLDAQGTKREDIITEVKNRFGHDKVINIGTYLTEGARSTVLTVTRGMGLSVADGNNILDLLPNDKGVSWDIKDALYGNDKKDRKPAQDFINAVNKYPLMSRAFLAIQGVVSGMGQHASGVSVTNDIYTNHFPSMKTSNGLVVSQWDAHELEEVGVVKFDFLSINALDRIKEAMDLLIKNNLIEWQGDLKSTYNKYFSLDNIDVNDKKLFDALNSGDVWKVFQFSSPVALQGLKKVQPTSFMELATTNSLIRLTTSGEQPIDKYIRFKKDINLWYKEMDDNGLSKKEQDILKKYVAGTYGIMDSQEKLMRISMDKDISNFSMKEANRLRKSVAKKDPVLQEKEHDEFFNKCFENGTSEALTKYVWDFLFAPTLSYSFSEPHTYAYTGIGVVEMYISAYFPSVYWKTASLSVDAGAFGGQFSSIDYVSISSAVTEAKSLIELPDINLSEIGFAPNNDKILFGLGAISGIGNDDIKLIVNHRPYTSFNDFMDRVGDNFSTKKIATLIKSGLFHSFNNSTRNLAVDYLQKYTPRKEKLTTVQLPKIIDNIPNQYEAEKKAYQLSSSLFGRNAKVLTSEMETYILKNHSNDFAINYDNGKMIVDEKSFKKWFNKTVLPLKEWLKTNEAVEALAKHDMRETWLKEFLGNEAQWYFGALSFYPFMHELEYTNIHEVIDLDKFSELPEEGKKVDNRVKYERGVVAGTVIDKDKRGLITMVSNTDEVLTVRVGKDRYSKYNKKNMQGEGKNRVLVEDSWFVRGTTLVVVGYRRQNDFVANKYGTGYKTELMKVVGFPNVELKGRAD